MKYLQKKIIVLILLTFSSCVADVQHKEEYYSNGILKKEYYIRNGKFEGAYKAFYENGNIQAIGQHKNGKMTGIWKYYWTNGNIQTVQEIKKGRTVSINSWNSDGMQVIKNGTGVVTHYYDNGQIASRVSYKNNVPDGKWETWHSDGTKESETYWKYKNWSNSSVLS